MPSDRATLAAAVLAAAGLVLVVLAAGPWSWSRWTIRESGDHTVEADLGWRPDGVHLDLTSSDGDRIRTTQAYDADAPLGDVSTVGGVFDAAALGLAALGGLLLVGLGALALPAVGVPVPGPGRVAAAVALTGAVVAGLVLAFWFAAAYPPAVEQTTVMEMFHPMPTSPGDTFWGQARADTDHGAMAMTWGAGPGWFAVLLAGLAPLPAAGLALIGRSRAGGPSAREGTGEATVPPSEVLAGDPDGGDRYDVLRHLGTGGMGRTYLARDRVIGRDVVVKEILPHLRQEPANLRAFLREARIVGKINHPNVVTLYDVVRDDGVVLVMEHVPGGNLEDALDPPVPLATAVGILDQVLAALEVLHAEGIVHRDVKPRNVLAAGDGQVKLADFGIAHVPGGETAVTGQQPGTVRYMAPEQITGGDVDGRADLYGATALLYELLAGQPYLDFEGRTLYDAQRAVVEEPPRLPLDDLPDAANALLEQGLAKRPSDRFQDAGAMRRALRDLPT